MIKKRIGIMIFTMATLTALVTSLAAPALAQSGDQGTGTNQDNQAGQEDNQGNNNNQGSNQNNDDQNGNQNNGQTGNNNQGANMNSGAGMNQGVGANQGAGMNQTNAAQACAQTYVVQAGDSLSAIASRFYNDTQGFNTIIQATNAAVGTGGAFTTISDPNVITPGQTLCIPNQAGMANGMSGSGVMTGTGATTMTMASGSNEMNNQLANSSQGLLIVENFTDGDMVFDLTQPAPTSAWIGPNQTQEFMLDPGMHQYYGHHPLGEYGVAPGSVEITAGQVTRLSCFRGQCQEVQATAQQQPGQSGQMQQNNQQMPAGQEQMQPGQSQQSDQMQQSGQSPQSNNNGGNGNGNNNNNGQSNGNSQ